MNSKLQLPIMPTLKAAWHKTYGAKADIWSGLTLIGLIVLCVSLLILGGLSFLLLYFYPEQALAIIIPTGTVIAKLLQYLTQNSALYMGIERAKDHVLDSKMAYVPFQRQRLVSLLAIWVVYLILFFPALHVTQLAKEDKSAFMFICAVLLAFLTVYIVLRIVLSTAFVLDKQYDTLRAISASIEATRGHEWHLLGIYALLGAFMIVLTLPLGIGLIWGFPFAMVCHGLIYRTLAYKDFNALEIAKQT